MELAMDLFKFSTDITGAEWSDLKQVTSPCPTLKVIGGISKYMIAREEMKRMTGGRPGFNADGTPIKVTKFKKTAVVADRVVGSVLGNTVGRVGRFVGKRLLGRIPDEAYARADLKSVGEPVVSVPTSEAAADVRVREVESIEISSLDQASLEDEIAKQIFSSDVTANESETMKQSA